MITKNATTKELVEKYNIQLEEMARFPVWTLEQIYKHLHICHNTVVRLVSYGIIYKFQIGKKCTYYSLKKNYYSNYKAKKSIMMIEFYYRTHFYRLENFVYYDKLDDKSLISRDVQLIGYDVEDTEEGQKPRYYYSFCDVRDLVSENFDYLMKLIKDIQCHSPSGRIRVYFVTNSSLKEEIKDYLRNNYEFINLKKCGYVDCRIVQVENKNFSYLKL